MFEMNNAAVIAQQELTEMIHSLPMSLAVQDVAKFLGICLTTAYKLVAEDSFPKVKMNGIKRIVIPKSKFIEWYLGNET